MNEITVEKLYWKPDSATHPITNRISTQFPKGRFIGILGPNGSGKTSFARQVLHLMKSDDGRISYDNTNVAKLSRKQIAKSIAFLPQNTQVDTEFTVYDIVAMGRTPHKSKFEPLSDKDKQRIEEAMEYANCKHLRERIITSLSGGERQRVLIARTIAQETDFILLDEPISSLDIKHQVELMNTFSKLQTERGVTVIAILHDLNMAASYCTDIILMRQGEIYKQGKKEEVLQPDILQAVYGISFELVEKEGGEYPFIVPVIR